MKDLHPHAIVNATPSGTQSSVVNAFTQPKPLPKAAPKSFQFVDAPAPHELDADLNENILEMSMDSFFREHGFMDPELSAAWDEDHGLKAKRARTASVSEFVSPLLDFVLTAPCRTIQCYSGEITVVNRRWMRCYGLRAEACMGIRPVEDVRGLAPYIVAKIVLEANYTVRDVSWRHIAVAHFTLLRLVDCQIGSHPVLKPCTF